MRCRCTVWLMRRLSSRFSLKYFLMEVLALVSTLEVTKILTVSGVLAPELVTGGFEDSYLLEFDFEIK